jgi:hypothetical protein
MLSGNNHTLCSNHISAQRSALGAPAITPCFLFRCYANPKNEKSRATMRRRLFFYR